MANPHVSAMLKMLCDEAGFLVESKVRKALENVPQEEGERMRVDTILKALGVENEEGVEKLSQYLVQEDDCEIPFVGADMDGHPLCNCWRQSLTSQIRGTNLFVFVFVSQFPVTDLSPTQPGRRN